MKETAELIQRCQALDFQNLPPEIVDRAKYLLLDYLGVAGRGALSDSAVAARKMVANLESAPKGAVVIGTKQSASPPYAALLNGIAAHSIELDDVVNEASLHPGVTVMSAALAAGHLANRSGKELITGIVAGYEVVIRLGIGLDPSAHYARGFHPTATCGALGSAITAAKILGLSAVEMKNALGIAGSQAAGLMEFLSDGAFTKRFHAGWAAHSGLLAALLAREGFTGPGTVIEGKFGFLKSYSDRPDPDRVLAAWGNPYQVMKTSIKPHACCRYKQGPIDGILTIMRKHGLTAADIESVELAVLKTGFALVVEPETQKQNPQSIVDAQFSMPFGAAVAILFGKASLDEYSQENLSSPEVRKMMSRIRCVADAELEKDFPRKWPARVAITTGRGQEFSIKIDFPKGDPENPLTWEELIAKYKELVQPVYSVDRISKLIETIKRLEHVDTLKSLSELLPAG
ncbi:MAG: MmgE/PrpD family protein [Desulfobacterales bacterium]|nr:MmgE/PrpD family protein [Desulfobacterales bacterium]